MVLHPHPKCLHFLLQVPADAAHAQDPEGFAFGVVAEGWWGISAPGIGAESDHGGIEGAEGAEDEEHGCVGCGVVDGGGDIGDMDGVGCAGGDVDLVVTGAWGEEWLVSCSSARIRMEFVERK